MKELSQQEVTEIQQAFQRGDFATAENLARSLHARIPTDDPLAITTAHFLARALFASGKLNEARGFVDLATKMLKTLNRPMNAESMLISVLNAQIVQAMGYLDNASKILEKIIDECAKEGILDQIHVPVILQCILLTKLKKTDRVFYLLETYLPVMKQQPSAQYRDTLRNLWRSLAQSSSSGSDFTKIVRLMLNSDVHDTLTIKSIPNHEDFVPPEWAEDAISNFLQLAENNTIATFVNNKTQFKSLINIDARLQVTLAKAHEVVIMSADQRLGANFSPEKIAREDWLELYFLMRAHAALLGAIRLATSGQYAETNMVLRGALENAMYCFRVADDPTLKQVWFDRYKDAHTLKRSKDKFSIANIGLRMKAVHSITNDECVRLYDQLIDYGAHPNEKTFATLASATVTSLEITLSVAALDPDHLDQLLDTCIDVGLVMLEIFSLAMPACTAAPPAQFATSEQIAKRAYERWCNHGYAHGQDEYDWYRAEAEIRCNLI